MANLIIAILIALIVLYVLVATFILNSVTYLLGNKKSFKISLITVSVSTGILLLVPIILSAFQILPHMFLKCYVLTAQPIITGLVYKKVSNKPWKETVSTMVLVSICQSLINLISWVI